jgi:hypothetical protein
MALQFYLSAFALSFSVYITLRVHNHLCGAKVSRLLLWCITLFVPILFHFVFGMLYVTLAMFIALAYFSYVCGHKS